MTIRIPLFPTLIQDLCPGYRQHSEFCWASVLLLGATASKPQDCDTKDVGLTCPCTPESRLAVRERTNDSAWGSAWENPVGCLEETV